MKNVIVLYFFKCHIFKMQFPVFIFFNLKHICSPISKAQFSINLKPECFWMALYGSAHNYTSQDVLYRNNTGSRKACCTAVDYKCYSFKSQAFGFVGSTKQNQHLFKWNLLQYLLQCTDLVQWHYSFSAIVCTNAGTAAIKTPDKQEKDKSII